jgi:hypothetical protein
VSVDFVLLVLCFVMSSVPVRVVVCVVCLLWVWHDRKAFEWVNDYQDSTIQACMQNEHQLSREAGPPFFFVLFLSSFLQQQKDIKTPAIKTLNSFIPVTNRHDRDPSCH